MLSGASAQAAFPEEETHMANPFTYLELHSTDPGKAKRFYSELFGWQTKDTDVPGFGTYTEIDIGEGPGAGLMAQPDPSSRSAWRCVRPGAAPRPHRRPRAKARCHRRRAADGDQGRRLCPRPQLRVAAADVR